MTYASKGGISWGASMLETAIPNKRVRIRVEWPADRSWPLRAHGAVLRTLGNQTLLVQ